ncbi:uncharacterized protein LOC134814113 [Bolinopsis microptera]|uniref:uncharacterized protein LOC134814113 n=2 Tax=Bolinopsis microptera TaxID=2820187 RepID=UPI00307A7BE1
MLSRILVPSPLLRTVSKLSTFDSITGPGVPYKGRGPWVLTIPQLETNTESSALLPWKSQIPMTVRYKIPKHPPSQRHSRTISPEVSNLLRMQTSISLITPSIITPNGVASWGNISAPEQDPEVLIEDPVVTRETYKTRQKGTHRLRVIRGRPKPQVTQRIRRKRRRLQKLWDTKEKERQKAIIKLREDNFKTEKKRVQSSDWWDWYVPYDNKPMQF